LSTTQMQALTTNQIQNLTTQQIHVLSTAQQASFTSDQFHALTTQQVQALNFNTPLVLDLSGNGIQTLGLGAGVDFDVADTGSQRNTGWIGSGNGFLVMDRNGDGTINNGSELFGSGTTLANGQKASTGYQALAELDTNHDGVINSQDADFSKLDVWVDSNADGVSEAGELHTLGSLGITQLNLNAKTDVSGNNGNIVGLVSSFETSDGQSHEMADVWLAQGAKATTPAAPAPAPSAGLRDSVSGLVHAMAAFEGGGGAPAGNTPKLDLAAALQGANVSASVGQMADLLKRFDADGKLLSGSTTAAPGDATLRLNALHHSGGAGFLATPQK